MTQLIEVEKENKNQVLVSQPMHLIEMAISNNADIEKLEKLMALQERWNAQEAKKSFLSAMSSFQRNCPDILKAKQGHNYLYAPLSDIVTQIRDVLASNGLSYRFEQNHDAGIQVTCIVSHNDGHSELTTMKANPDTSGSKNAIQAIGSTVQYLMRYTLIGALGITTADIDMDGRLPQKQQEMISQESEMWLADHYNALPDESKPKMLAWLKVDSVGAICNLTEEAAQSAIKAIKAKK
jgi:hypothetical protein